MAGILYQQDPGGFENSILAVGSWLSSSPHDKEAHTVYVLTEHPLQSLLRRSDFKGRMEK